MPAISAPPRSLPRNAPRRLDSLPALSGPRENVKRVEPAPAEAPPTPFIRIRTLLLLAVIGCAAWIGYPRAVAAWRLHEAATKVANYAVCMVGPTGPALLRDK